MRDFDEATEDSDYRSLVEYSLLDSLLRRASNKVFLGFISGRKAHVE